jgi:hypothetical protein
VTNAPSVSNHPHPTRNASVPAPPLSPVVSRVEEEKRRPRRGPVREERRIVRSEVETFCGVTDPFAAVARQWLHAAVDDETAGVPGAAQSALEDGERARMVW